MPLRCDSDTARAARRPSPTPLAANHPVPLTSLDLLYFYYFPCLSLCSRYFLFLFWPNGSVIRALWTQFFLHGHVGARDYK